jgi:hypothetical protein
LADAFPGAGSLHLPVSGTRSSWTRPVSLRIGCVCGRSGGRETRCRVCSGGLPVGGASGGPVGVEIGGVLSPGEWLLSGTRGGGSDGSGGVGSRCRLRTVRSIGVPGPRDSPVSRGRACLSDPSVQQMEAAGRVCGSRGFSPLAVGPVCEGVGGFRTSLGFRVLLFPSWGVCGVLLNRCCSWWAARRAAWASSAWHRVLY